MFDTTHAETADEILDRVDNTRDFVNLCQDYFEISIGYRRPSQPEIDAALVNLRGAYTDTDPTLESRVQVMKYPLASSPITIRMTLAHEYIIFKIVSIETDIVEQPYIPMLRYEIQMQDELEEERRYNEAIIRQAALFQTYLRMSQNNFDLNWSDCLDHGQNKITPPRLSPGAKERIEEVYDSRSEMGHDWRVYIEPTSDNSQLQVYAKGRWVLDELRSAELDETYKSYTGNSTSLRLPVEFSERERATVSTDTASATLTRSCPECGTKLDESPNSCSTCGWRSDDPVNS